MRWNGASLLVYKFKRWNTKTHIKFEAFDVQTEVVHRGAIECDEDGV